MYSYEKFNLRLFPLFLLILSIVFVFSRMYIESGIVGGIGTLFAFSFNGIQIDPETMRYRKYDRFLWFYIGNWQPIHSPQYVTVVRINLSGQRIRPIPMPVPDDSSVKSFKLNLIVDSKERYISLIHGSRDKMIEEGIKIANTLQIRFLDHSRSEKEWII